MFSVMYSVFFFFNDPATTEIYTLSLHDALPISVRVGGFLGLPPTFLVVTNLGVTTQCVKA